MDLKTNVQGLLDLLGKDKMLDAFEKYYADDVVMVENNDPPRVGKAKNREFEKEFLSGIETLHSSEIKNVAYNEDTNVAMIHSFMDVTFKGAGRIQMEEVAVQTWKNGQIVHEKFFYKG